MLHVCVHLLCIHTGVYSVDNSCLRFALCFDRAAIKFIKSRTNQWKDSHTFILLVLFANKTNKFNNCKLQLKLFGHAAKQIYEKPYLIEIHFRILLIMH